jgi:hypothetical protein
MLLCNLQYKQYSPPKPNEARNISHPRTLRAPIGKSGTLVHHIYALLKMNVMPIRATITWVKLVSDPRVATSWLHVLGKGGTWCLLAEDISPLHPWKHLRARLGVSSMHLYCCSMPSAICCPSPAVAHPQAPLPGLSFDMTSSAVTEGNKMFKLWQSTNA